MDTTFLIYSLFILALVLYLFPPGKKGSPLKGEWIIVGYILLFVALYGSSGYNDIITYYGLCIALGIVLAVYSIEGGMKSIVVGQILFLVFFMLYVGYTTNFRGFPFIVVGIPILLGMILLGSLTLYGTYNLTRYIKG